MSFYNIVAGSSTQLNLLEDLKEHYLFRNSMANPLSTMNKKNKNFLSR